MPHIDLFLTKFEMDTTSYKWNHFIMNLSYCTQQVQMTSNIMKDLSWDVTTDRLTDGLLTDRNTATNPQL